MPFTCDADAIEFNDDLGCDMVQLRFTRGGDLVTVVHMTREAAEKLDLSGWAARTAASRFVMPSFDPAAAS